MLAKIYKCAFVEVSALLAVNMESVCNETLKKLQKYRIARERAEGERRRRANSQNRLIGRIVHHGRRFASVLV
ncbi:hypothetical protein AAVH_08485 [Aphelenchoides avenae]|nr:hypothetical protein AAVH_08485 [Aphelenchus avenae]